MTIALPEFPSSAAFDAMNATFEASDADRQEAKNQGKAVFQFNLKNASGVEHSWSLDLEKEGKVFDGPHKKPTVTLSLTDENFGKLVEGKANAQKLFMGGKLKVKGDVMKATKLTPILDKAKVKAKL
ncbi:hypothetical protein MKZ38_002951 [Zalerion maritima]|uniref:SCP2 domain-containing protein n=1 Tax=Zalerion maritima TaxID=339359 RepID=A0AAD5RP00_9PEZI|nr:hypothetical protein MKZ38_002951 [Zalerion maritima]